MADCNIKFYYCNIDNRDWELALSIYLMHGCIDNHILHLSIPCIEMTKCGHLYTVHNNTTMWNVLLESDWLVDGDICMSQQLQFFQSMSISYYHMCIIAIYNIMYKIVYVPGKRFGFWMEFMYRKNSRGPRIKP